MFAVSPSRVLAYLVLLFSAAVLSRGALLDPFDPSAPVAAAFPPLVHTQPPKRMCAALFDAATGTAKVALPTNKFWGNVMVGDGSKLIAAQPYLLRFTATGEMPYGMMFSNDAAPTFGPADAHGANQYYYRSAWRQMAFGAAEFGTVLPGLEIMSTDQLFSSTLRMWATNNGYIEMPIVRGMAYVTASYTRLTPQISTWAAIVSVNGAGSGAQLTGQKFKIELNNGQTWLLYAYPAITLTFNNNQLTASAAFAGTLRLSVLPAVVGAESVLDERAPVWVTSGQLSANTVDKSHAWYRFTWATAGDTSVQPLHYAYPHHLSILDQKLATVTSVQLATATKGMATAVIGSQWTLREVGLSQISWLPPVVPPADMLPPIQSRVLDDLTKFVYGELNADGFYPAGKWMLKLAQICLISAQWGQSFAANTSFCLNQLESGFNRFISRTSRACLGYDKTYRGLVRVAGSSAMIADQFLDFGSAFYNDHHFHFGYFVTAAAIIRHLDPAWATTVVPETGMTADQWVTTLIRDVANPSSQDSYFPQFRYFDWFSGHSWANGLFEVGDGKDEESSSEEVNFLYGLAMWGLASNKPDMFNLGNLMFAVARRSVNAYFLLSSSNTNHPGSFVANIVSGMTFEGKIDHAKWFEGPEYCIHGVQMLPVLPVTQLVRYPTFVQREWDYLGPLSGGWSVDTWGSLILTNYAIINPSDAFSRLLNHPRSQFDASLSSSWALFFAASRPDPYSVAPPVDPSPADSWQYAAGGQVAVLLRSSSGHLLKCDAATDTVVGVAVPAGSALGAEFRWTLTDAQQGQRVLLQCTANWKFLTVSDTRYLLSMAYASPPGDSQKFWVRPITNGVDVNGVFNSGLLPQSVALASQFGSFLSVRSDGVVRADRWAVDTNEHITIDSDQSTAPAWTPTVVIRTSTGDFLSCASNALSAVNLAPGSSIPDTLRWIASSPGTPTISLQCVANKLFVSARPPSSSGSYPLLIVSEAAAGWETFDVHPIVDGAASASADAWTVGSQVALFSQWSRFVGVESDAVVGSHSTATSADFLTIAPDVKTA